MGIKERHERDREAVRRAILDAARELFVTEGYQNVSIRKVAERIEYSPAAIYLYFPSKDDIFFALAEEGFRLLGDPVDLVHQRPIRRAGAAGSHPRHLLARLRIQLRTPPVLRLDVRRSIGAPHHPRVRAVHVRPRHAESHRRADSRVHRRQGSARHPQSRGGLPAADHGRAGSGDDAAVGSAGARRERRRARPRRPERHARRSPELESPCNQRSWNVRSTKPHLRRPASLNEESFDESPQETPRLHQSRRQPHAGGPRC